MNRLTLFRTLATMVACLALALPASAYDFAKDGIYYVINGTNVFVTYKDTDYNSYSGTVIIPSTVTNNGTTYNVVQINPYAFKGTDQHHPACQLYWLFQLCVWRLHQLKEHHLPVAHGTQLE